jgi:hypothetical protein
VWRTESLSHRREGPSHRTVAGFAIKVRDPLHADKGLPSSPVYVFRFCGHERFVRHLLDRISILLPRTANLTVMSSILGYPSFSGVIRWDDTKRVVLGKPQILGITHPTACVRVTYLGCPQAKALCICTLRVTELAGDALALRYDRVSVSTACPSQPRVKTPAQRHPHGVVLSLFLIKSTARLIANGKSILQWPG